VANVWVGVRRQWRTVLGYQLTNSSGAYSSVVPNNVPPSTKPYQVMVVVPNGSYATTSTVLQPIWLSANQVLTGKNFGVLDYQISVVDLHRAAELTAALRGRDGVGRQRRKWRAQGHRHRAGRGYGRDGQPVRLVQRLQQHPAVLDVAELHP
jgi:hypothetical protein